MLYLRPDEARTDLALSPDGFDRTVALPPGQLSRISRMPSNLWKRKPRNSSNFTSSKPTFSAESSASLGVRALDSLSPYKRHKHPDVAQQRFPDLSLRGKLNPPPTEALESKGSSRSWAIQSHYNHPGWYQATDWKFEGSKAKGQKKVKAEERTRSGYSIQNPSS